VCTEDTNASPFTTRISPFRNALGPKPYSPVLSGMVSRQIVPSSSPFFITLLIAPAICTSLCCANDGTPASNRNPHVHKNTNFARCLSVVYFKNKHRNFNWDNKKHE